MNADDLALPWFVHPLWILGIFLISLVSFHILFLRLISLSPIGWKKVDYYWLAMALVSLMGAVGARREIIATNTLEYSKSRIDGAFNFMRMRAEFGSSAAICRTFIPSDFSPPPSEMESVQKQFDNQCTWFKNVNSVISTLDTKNPVEIDPAALFGSPPIDGIEWAGTSFLDSVQNYNSTVRAIRGLESAASQTGFETFLKLLGPALLAIALALRITKVSGEVRNERKKTNG